MPSLLIVDDNRELARLLAVVAEAYGFSPTLAYTGQEARAALKSPPEVALVDLLLPDAKGMDLIAEFTGAGVRCAAMSGVFKGSSCEREAATAGAHVFFEKPFVAREVMEQLSTRLAATVPHLEEVPELDAESLTPLEDAEAELLASTPPPSPPLEELEPEALEPIEELAQLVGPSAGAFTRTAATPASRPAVPEAVEEETRVVPAPPSMLAALEEIGGQEDPTVVYPPPPPASTLEQEVAEFAAAAAALEASAFSPAEFPPDAPSPAAAPPAEPAPAASLAGLALSEAEAAAPAPPEVPFAVAAPDVPAEPEAPVAAAAPAEPEAPAAAAAPAPGEPAFPAPCPPAAAPPRVAPSPTASAAAPPAAGPSRRAAAAKPSGAKAPAPARAVKIGASPSVPLPFSDRRVWRPAAATPATGAAKGASWPRAGSLAETSLPRLLTALHQARQTGELRLRRRNVVKVLGLRDGHLAFAVSNLSSDRFGPAAVRAGLLAADALKELQSEAERSSMKTADAAAALALLPLERRPAIVERQVKEIAWSVLDWNEGEYQFALRSPRSDLVPLALAVGPLVLEGLRRTYTLVKLRALLAPETRLFPTADPPYELHELALRDHDALLLAHVDGSKTVEDLVMLGELEERATLALLHGLQQLGILEARAVQASRRVVLV